MNSELNKILDEEIEKIKYKTIIDTTVKGYIEAVNLVDRVLLEVPKSSQKNFKIIIKECNCE